MAAPFTAAITDDFNRNPGGAPIAPGANWTSPWTTFTPPPHLATGNGGWSIQPSPTNYLGQSGVGSSSASVNTNSWNAATFLGADLYATIANFLGNTSSIYLFQRIQNPGTTTA